MMSRPTALTIAGSDPSGGAGIQADLKTFHQHGVYGMAVIAALTAQSTRAVTGVWPMAPEVLEAQLETLFADISPRAIKTGALVSAENIEVVSRSSRRGSEVPLVVDPVMISKHGARLLAPQAERALRRELVPRATLITPNTHEAAALLGREVRTLADARRAAEDLLALGAPWVLLKGGHLEGAPIDVLASATGIIEIEAERIDTPHTHGTGCTYSAAITARLAKGEPLLDAVRGARAWLAEAMREPARVGGGINPVDHFAAVRGPRGGA